MQKFLLKLASFSLLITLLTTSCGDDPIVDLELGPNISLQSGVDLIDSDATVSPGQDFDVRVSASRGDNDLSLFTILEDGSRMPLDRLAFESGSNFGSAANTINDAGDQAGFTTTLTITAPTAAGSYNYSFQVDDTAGKSESTSVTITVEGKAPTLTTSTGNMFVVEANSLVGVRISVEQGSAPLSTIAVYESGAAIAANRVRLNGVEFDANPYTLGDADKGGLVDAELILRAQDDVSDRTYTVEVIDEAGLTSTFDVTISTNVSTPLAEEYSGVLLFNIAGENLGSLDLQTGTPVSIGTASADIRDLGIDLNEPAASNWIQKIEPVNGAELRVPGDNQVEGFSYTSIDSREALIDAFNLGTAVEVSDKVAVGDVFLALSEGQYFIFEVEDIVITTDNNRDYYQLNIKRSGL